MVVALFHPTRSSVMSAWRRRPLAEPREYHVDRSYQTGSDATRGFTKPHRPVVIRDVGYGARSQVGAECVLVRSSAHSEKLLHQLAAFGFAHAGDDLETVIVSRQLGAADGRDHGAHLRL